MLLCFCTTHAIHQQTIYYMIHFFQTGTVRTNICKGYLQRTESNELVPAEQDLLEMLHGLLNLWEGSRNRFQVELPGIPVRATLLNWAAKIAVDVAMTMFTWETAMKAPGSMLPLLQFPLTKQMSHVTSLPFASGPNSSLA